MKNNNIVVQSVYFTTKRSWRENNHDKCIASTDQKTKERLPENDGSTP